MSTVLILLLVGAPLVAALVELTVLGRPGRPRSGGAAALGAGVALAAVVTSAIVAIAGSPVRLGDEPAWLAADGLGLLVAGVAAVIGLTVLTYARRAIDPGPDAVRTAAAGATVLGGTLLVATAGRLSILTLGWVVSTLAVLALLHHRHDPARRHATRRAGLTLGLGDAALVAATVIVLAVAGDPALDGLGGIVPALSDASLGGIRALDVVALLLVVAALARAAQMPLPSWLPGTLAAPTPTSALLHAGVVNAGAVLLVRSLDLLGAAPAAAWLLAASTVATIVITAGAVLARPDAKGGLALSTSAQMGFMLLAVAVGAPAAAITHLVGHALYKSARFLGVGATIGTDVRVRRFAPGPASPDGRIPVVARVVAAAAVGAGVAWATVLVLPPGEAPVVGAALAAAAVTGTWSWLARPRASARAAVAGTGVVLAASLGALGIAAGLESIVAPSLPEAPDVVPAAVALGALLVAGSAGTLVLRHPVASLRAWSLLAGVGRPAVPSARPAATPAHRADLHLAHVRSLP